MERNCVALFTGKSVKRAQSCYTPKNTLSQYYCVVRIVLGRVYYNEKSLQSLSLNSICV